MKHHIIAILLVSCRPSNTPESFSCDTAFRNLNRLGCEEAHVSNKGISFPDLCEEMIAKKYYINTKCLSTISSCEEVSSCEQ